MGPQGQEVQVPLLIIWYQIQTIQFRMFEKNINYIEKDAFNDICPPLWINLYGLVNHASTLSVGVPNWIKVLA